jgi:transcriptional regulator with XRE-family HTH domain
MESLDLEPRRIRAVLTMFRISQGELAHAANISPAMLSLTLAGKKRPSERTAVALIHGLEKLLTQGRRLDTSYFVNTGVSFGGG